MRIRQTAVAGMFYPAEKKELNTALSELLRETRKLTQKKLKILVVPHAGIGYSGSVAAWGYRQLVGENYHRVVLLGVSHRHRFSKIMVDDSQAWKTPLGPVKIDKNLCSKLIEAPHIVANPEVHVGEHSLELQVIFAQKVLKNFKIVPILISQMKPKTEEMLIGKLVEILKRPRSLLVVSTDLSHYPSYEVACRVDRQTIGGIVSGNAKTFEETVEKLRRENHPGVETVACGAEAVKVALEVGEKIGVKDWRLLRYQNSGDAGGDRIAVVGYAAVGGWKRRLKTHQREALEIARRTLVEFLEKGKIPKLKVKTKELLEKRGVFVTLKSDGRLRGCVGELEATDPVYRLIQKMVLSSAIRDPRFPPVSKSELPFLKIEVSLLSPLRPVDDWEKIRLGREGVVVEKGKDKAVFLPQVAKETGWDLREFLGRLCVKAGLPPEAYRDKQTKLWRFEVEKFEG